MNSKLVLCCVLLFVSLGHLGAADHRSPSPEGASVGFSNLSDGATVPPVFVVRFSVVGMGIARPRWNCS